jgi:type IX secretion system PorP/SprF family membrane protein
MNIVHRTFFGILLVSAVISYQSVYSQQHPIFTQYMFNGLVINPAYSGSHESMTMTATMRKQWTGIQGAPQTGVFSAHSPIKFTRSAAGMAFTYDNVGITKQSMVYGTYAYHIPVSEHAKVAVGGQAGLTFYRGNFSELDVVTQNNVTDPSFASNDARTLPNLGIGVYYYNKRTYVGLSLPTLVNNKWNNLDPIIHARQQRHYFLSAGHIFDLSHSLKLKPNVLFKYVEHGPFQYDINANLLIQEILWVGVSYRMKDAVDILTQWNINDQFSVGYSYGYPTSSLASIQSGTHEIVLNYRFRQNKHIVLSPRYF